METIQKIHGIPKIIVSDRYPIFTSNFWKKIFTCLGTELAHRSPYHPQSYGKINIMNKFPNVYLCLFSFDKKHNGLSGFPK